MITRIEITNLMSHEQTVIEPARGLTVIAGPNNIGKSSVVAALQLLCYNERSTYVLRHGERRCHVIVETDDGHRIEWTRGKNGGAAYEIDGVRHDRLQGSVPDAVHEILKMPKIATQAADRQKEKSFDLHFGEQKSPVFLINESESTIAQFFAASSDAGHLIAMQNLHKENIRNRRRELAQLSATKNGLVQRLEFLDPVDEIVAASARAQRHYNKIQQRSAEITRLENDIEQLSRTVREAGRFSEVAAILNGLQPAPELNETSALESMVVQMESTVAEITVNTLRQNCLSELAEPPAIADTLPLEHLTRGIELQSGTVIRKSAQRTALALLSPPPEIVDANPLESVIAELEHVQRQQGIAHSRCTALELLVPVEEPAETFGLELVIAGLVSEHNRAMKLSEKKQTLDTKLTRFHAQIESWVVENPVCPTCGGNVSADNLLCELHVRHSAQSSAEETRRGDR